MTQLSALMCHEFAKETFPNAETNAHLNSILEQQLVGSLENQQHPEWSAAERWVVHIAAPATRVEYLRKRLADFVKNPDRHRAKMGPPKKTVQSLRVEKAVHVVADAVLAKDEQGKPKVAIAVTQTTTTPGGAEVKRLTATNVDTARPVQILAPGATAGALSVAAPHLLSRPSAAAGAAILGGQSGVPRLKSS